MEPASNMPAGVRPPTSVQAAVGTLAAASAGEPIRVVVEESGGGLLGRFAFWAGWAGFAVCFIALMATIAATASYFDTTGGMQEKHYFGNQNSSDKIAVITIRGTIGEGEGFVKNQIDRVAADDNVKAIVVRVESPGGTVTGSDYMLHHLKELKKAKEEKSKKKVPLVVSMGSIAASGGYYVSMAVGDEKDSIYAEPTTTTGSIGVIIPHYDIKGLMDQYHVVDDSLASHDRKKMLSMTRSWTEDDKKIINAYLMEAFERFKGVVKEGRPGFAKDPTALDDLATGEIFSADRALKLGLVDKIGFIEEATARAAELAGLSKDNYRVVRYESTSGLLDRLSGLGMRSQAGPLEGLMEFATPKAHYLCTTLPIWMRAE